MAHHRWRRGNRRELLKGGEGSGGRGETQRRLIAAQGLQRPNRGQGGWGLVRQQGLGQLSDGQQVALGIPRGWLLQPQRNRQTVKRSPKNVSR